MHRLVTAISVTNLDQAQVSTDKFTLQENVESSVSKCFLLSFGNKIDSSLCFVLHLNSIML